MKISNYVMDLLVRQGLKHLFLLPAGSSMHLVDSAGQNPDFMRHAQEWQTPYPVVLPEDWDDTNSVWIDVLSGELAAGDVLVPGNSVPCSDIFELSAGEHQLYLRRHAEDCWEVLCCGLPPVRNYAPQGGKAACNLPN